MRAQASAILLAVSTAAMAGQPPDRLTQVKARERYDAGQQLLLKDAFPEAAQEFRAAVELDPTLALAHYGLGRAYMGMKDYAQAIQAYTRCREVFTELASSSVDKGERLNQWVEDEIRALKDRRMAVEAQLRQTGNGNPVLQRTLLAVNHRIDELDHLRQRQDRDSAVPAGVALALGSAYLRAGRLGEAEKEYLAALEGNPRMGEAHNNLAYVYMVTGRVPEAERELKLAEKSGFRVNPGFKEELSQKRR